MRQGWTTSSSPCRRSLMRSQVGSWRGRKNICCIDSPILCLLVSLAACMQLIRAQIALLLSGICMFARGMCSIHLQQHLGGPITTALAGDHLLRSAQSSMSDMSHLVRSASPGGLGFRSSQDISHLRCEGTPWVRSRLSSWPLEWVGDGVHTADMPMTALWRGCVCVRGRMGRAGWARYSLSGNWAPGGTMRTVFGACLGCRADCLDCPWAGWGLVCPLLAAC